MIWLHRFVARLTALLPFLAGLDKGPLAAFPTLTG